MDSLHGKENRSPLAVVGCAVEHSGNELMVVSSVNFKYLNDCMRNVARGGGNRSSISFQRGKQRLGGGKKRNGVDGVPSDPRAGDSGAREYEKRRWGNADMAEMEDEEHQQGV